MTIKSTTAAIALALSLACTPAFAADKSMEASVAEARLEGQIATAILFNRHLNPFEISVDVEGETVILTGTVDEAIDKELAERVALNAEGVARVDNRIAVDSDWQPPERNANERSFGDRVTDATTTATVKSRLLWNRATSGLDIKVDTLDGQVSLTGNVASRAEKELAERIALDTEGVISVDNRLGVDGHAPNRVGEAAEKVGDAFSDSWITARVKSSLLYSRNVDGMDITVETRAGNVMLGGKADTSAERDLAVEIAKGISGVKQVNANAVKIQA